MPWEQIRDKAFHSSAEAAAADGGGSGGGAGARTTAAECGRAGVQVLAPDAAAAASLTSPTKQAEQTPLHFNAMTAPPESRCVPTTATLLDSTCAL